MYSQKNGTISLTLTVWGGGSSLHSGIEFGQSRTGEGSSGGRKRGVV